MSYIANAEKEIKNFATLKMYMNLYIYFLTGEAIIYCYYLFVHRRKLSCVSIYFIVKKENKYKFNSNI